MTADERIASLEALIAQQQEQIAEQREQIAQLSAYVRELEGRLAKDSHNSSKPPVVFSFLISSSSQHRAPRSLVAGRSIAPSCHVAQAG
jgi:uncharacterized coiled-coil protein SlyX